MQDPCPLLHPAAGECVSGWVGVLLLVGISPLILVFGCSHLSSGLDPAWKRRIIVQPPSFAPACRSGL